MIETPGVSCQPCIDIPVIRPAACVLAVGFDFPFVFYNGRKRPRNKFYRMCELEWMERRNEPYHANLENYLMFRETSMHKC